MNTVSKNQLARHIANLKERAKNARQEILYNFTADGGSVIVANKELGLVGLISSREDGSISCYEVDMGRWKWAHDEGFTTDEIASTNLRKEVFIPIISNKLINKLVGD
tara:strand:+ start:13702 stop:14025 length:324 start_codon:yes stop_codon:yes gene_type:complete